MKKTYLILDTETTTLPNLKNSKFALDFPLIYDFGYKLVDRHGNILETESAVVQEIFFNDELFEGAYYAHKKPQYMEKIANGTIAVKTWAVLTEKFENILKTYKPTVCAYNAHFDFKRAIPTTELFFKGFSSKGNFWKANLEKKVADRVNNVAYEGTYTPNPHFRFRKADYEIIDIWRVACENLLNTDKFRNYAFDNGYLTKSNYPKTSAEVVYRYLFLAENFIESHTAIEDVEIETEILFKGLTQKKTINKGIMPFPFRVIGKC